MSPRHFATLLVLLSAFALAPGCSSPSAHDVCVASCEQCGTNHVCVSGVHGPPVCTTTPGTPSSCTTFCDEEDQRVAQNGCQDVYDAFASCVDGSADTCNAEDNDCRSQAEALGRCAPVEVD